MTKKKIFFLGEVKGKRSGFKNQENINLFHLQRIERIGHWQCHKCGRLDSTLLHPCNKPHSGKVNMHKQVMANTIYSIFESHSKRTTSEKSVAQNTTLMAF
jgi:hypothetical protein